MAQVPLRGVHIKPEHSYEARKEHLRVQDASSERYVHMGVVKHFVEDVMRLQSVAQKLLVLSHMHSGSFSQLTASVGYLLPHDARQVPFWDTMHMALAAHKVRSEMYVHAGEHTPRAPSHWHFESALQETDRL